jgi:hypothetical protein
MKDNLLARIDSLALAQPCAFEDHYPLHVREQQTDQGPVVFGHVRTSSSILDGCGGRTDVHDLLSLFWAAILRANGVASSRLIDEGGFADIPGELYARWLAFDQIGESATQRSIKDRISAHTAHAFHALNDVVDWIEIGYPKSTWSNEADSLLSSLNAYGKFADFEDFAGRRAVPDWFYAKSVTGGVTVAVLPHAKAWAFRMALAAYDPVCFAGNSKTTIVSGDIKHAVSNRCISMALRLLKAVEGGTFVLWKGANASPMDQAIVLIPLESHCLFLGAQTIVSIQTDCGLRAYEAERTKFLERRASENAVFSVDHVFEWTEKTDGGRFEDLVYALLEREKGVAWVRQAGPTRERDGGRDFVARWTVSSESGAPPSLSGGKDEQIVLIPARAKNIVVQVKAHRPSVGKSKVVDIRDTIERHNAEGFFLVAFPQPANSLVEHLLSLARNGTWTDWWDRGQIESRLRKNLDLLARFSDLVVRSNTPNSQD